VIGFADLFSESRWTHLQRTFAGCRSLAFLFQGISDYGSNSIWCNTRASPTRWSLMFCLCDRTEMGPRTGKGEAVVVMKIIATMSWAWCLVCTKWRQKDVQLKLESTKSRYDSSIMYDLLSPQRGLGKAFCWPDDRRLLLLRVFSTTAGKGVAMASRSYEYSTFIHQHYRLLSSTVWQKLSLLSVRRTASSLSGFNLFQESDSFPRSTTTMITIISSIIFLVAPFKSLVEVQIGWNRPDSINVSRNEEFSKVNLWERE